MSDITFDVSGWLKIHNRRFKLKAPLGHEIDLLQFTNRPTRIYFIVNIWLQSAYNNKLTAKLFCAWCFEEKASFKLGFSLILLLKTIMKMRSFSGGNQKTKAILIPQRTKRDIFDGKIFNNFPRWNATYLNFGVFLTTKLSSSRWIRRKIQFNSRSKDVENYWRWCCISFM